MGFWEEICCTSAIDIDFTLKGTHMKTSKTLRIPLLVAALVAAAGLLAASDNGATAVPQVEKPTGSTVEQVKIKSPNSYYRGEGGLVKDPASMAPPKDQKPTEKPLGK